MTDIPDEAVQARSRSGASTVTECNATLTTATVHDCPNGSRVNASGYCKVCRDNYVTLLRTIKCERHDEDAFYPHSAQGAAWRDDTPGATPHKPPLVSDEEVTAALVVIGKDLLRGYDTEVSTVRAALEAAAKVRQSNE